MEFISNFTHFSAIYCNQSITKSHSSQWKLFIFRYVDMLISNHHFNYHACILKNLNMNKNPLRNKNWIALNFNFDYQPYWNCLYINNDRISGRKWTSSTLNSIFQLFFFMWIQNSTCIKQWGKKQMKKYWNEILREKKWITAKDRLEYNQIKHWLLKVLRKELFG